MKTITQLCLIFSILLLNLVGTNTAKAQNIGINGTGANAHTSALLDVDATGSLNKGLLIPRIPLTAINAAAPVTSPATSLLVYNTVSASTGTNAVSPGYYYWDGAKWVRFAYNPSGSISEAWTTTGNAGTTATTNFLGTTDAQDLVFRTNNIERMRTLSNGNIGIGTSAPIAPLEVNNIYVRVGGDGGPYDPLHATQTLFNRQIGSYTGGAAKTISFAENNIPIARLGTSATIASGSLSPSGSIFYINTDPSINNSWINPHFVITAGTAGAGNVGIGTSTPGAKLEVRDNGNRRTLHVEHDFNGLQNTDAAFIGGIDAGYSATGLFVLQKDNVSFTSTGTNLINVVQNSVSQMLINGSGNMGLGTPSPSQKLHVNEGNILISNTSSPISSIILSNYNGSAQTTSYISFINQTNKNWNQYMGGPGGYAGVQPNAMEWWYYPQLGGGSCCQRRFAILENTTSTGYAPVVIDASGQMFGNGWAQPSDKTLKTNIKPLTNALDKISKLGGYSYNFTKESNLDDGKVHIGVIAQEVEAVLPEAVSQFPQANYKAINYDALIPLQIEAIKELREENIQQKSQIVELLKRIEALEKK